jgi:hypothetical protein
VLLRICDVEVFRKQRPAIRTVILTFIFVTGGFSSDLSPPPLVEDPDRFYRSGEK